MSAGGYEAVVIGGSAGSLAALSRILPILPQNFPLPILIVIHLPPEKDSVMAELFQSKCAMVVCEARDKEPLKAGTVYFAPPDYHLLVEEDRSLALSYDEPQLFSRPSIDVLFESAADIFGEKLIGVILSGANNDGALGLKAVAAEGGVVLIQDPDEAYAGAMPASALKEIPLASVLTAEQIANFLMTEC